MIQDWYSVTIGALQNLWQGFVIFLPKVIGAILVFVFGWFFAAGIGKIIAAILKRLRFNRIFERGAWREALEKAEWKVDPSEFFGAIAKWILVIVFLLAAVEILGLVEFADFLKSILAYLPNVIIASAIFVVTVIVADIFEKVVRAAVEGIRVGYGHWVGAMVKWSIWVFAILAILHHLGIAQPLVQTLFTGLVAMLVISVGIAFGLGGKELAGEILAELRRKLRG